MAKHIKLSIDRELYESFSKEDMAELTDWVSTLIEAGAIEADENDEVVLDRDFIKGIVNVLENVKEVRNRYGQDEEGFVKYPFGEL